MKRKFIFASFFLLVGVACSKIMFAQIDFTTIWKELTPVEATANEIRIPSLAPLVKKAEPAVIVVYTEAVIERKIPGFPRGDIDPFEFFFGPRGPGRQLPEQKTRGQGSGFIIHPSGLAITNNHVVEGATKIRITVWNSLEEFDAEVLGTDPNSDVALIRIKSDKKDWPIIPLGNSGTLEKGDWVVAIGSPQGLVGTVTLGIISAGDRTNIDPGKHGLYNFIQTSAPINPGNSGGPLLNLKGEAIGMNTAIIQYANNIGFAIPVDQIKTLLPQLKEKGKVEASYIGVVIQDLDVNSEAAKEMGLPYTYGALVREVAKGSPAAKAGLKPGDVITHFNDKELRDSSALRVAAGLAGVGRKIVLTVVRDKKALKFEIVLEKLPGTEEEAKKPAPSKDKAITFDKIGLSAATGAMSDEHAAKLSRPKGSKAAIVVAVTGGKAAQRADIKVNDVIVQANGTRIDSAEKLEKVIKGLKGGQGLKLNLLRGDSEIFVWMGIPAEKKQEEGE